MGQELVECRSGFEYAERPVALYFEGERLEIERVEAAWRTPEGKRFRVFAGGRIFELVYDQGRDQWQVLPA